MAKVNIPSYIDDDFYRYTMPCLESHKEGSGNGRRTSIANLSNVAHAIGRDPQDIAKFLGHELATRAQYGNKKGSGERFVLNGHYDASKLQAALDHFIDKFVVCPKCSLPEADMVVKNRLLKGKCRACGWEGDLDNQHPLAAHVIKQAKPTKKPKKQDKSEGAKGREKDASEPQLDVRHKSPSRASGSKHERVDEGPLDAQNFPKDQVGKRGGKKEEGASEEVGFEDMAKEGGDGRDSDDGQITHGSKDLEHVIANVTKFAKSEGSSLTPDALFQELRVHQLAKGFDNRLRAFVAFSALFPDGSLDKKGIVGFQAHLCRLTKGVRFEDWIWGVDAYLDTNGAALKMYPLTLKQCYDLDLATEEEILEHYRRKQGGPGFSKAAVACQPFLNWLEIADEESSEEEEEAEEVSKP